MDPVFTLAIALLAGFLVGWLLARNTWLTFEGRQMRRDMRALVNMRYEVERHVALYNAEKKRADALLGEKRKLARTVREERYGKSVFRDPTLLAAHLELERARALIDRLTQKYGLAQTSLGHLAPLEGSTCWKCGKPATTRLGDSMYCNDCHSTGERAR